jgi:hypothetical protein
MSAVDENFDATGGSLSVVSVGIPPQHVLRQQRASLVARKGGIYEHYNLGYVSLGHMYAHTIIPTCLYSCS